MENSPFTPNTPESGNDKDPKDSSKKKKSAEAIGAIVVEPKQEKAAEPQGIFERLTGIKDKKEAPQESAKAEKPVSEAEAPLESLSDEERQYVESELASAARDESAPTDDDPETLAAEAAVENFRSKIVEKGEDSETAFTETLNELDNEEAPEEVETVEPASPETSDETFIDLRNEEDTPEPIVLGGSPPAPPRPPASNAGAIAPPPPGGESRGPASSAERPVVVENNDFGMFMVGGIVGYLIGRRRGRIKTEKRLLPIQKKLEKQVKGLQTELERKEFVIRQAAVEKMRKNSPEKQHKLLPPERIGKVLIEGGSARAEERRRSPLEGLTEKDIITLNRVELLAVSEKIIVEGTSLRHIYETHLVGERGLRRLVAEFLRGGNLNKALRRELVEKEIDFERDPILRDKNRSEGSDGGGTHLDALLKKVDNLPGGDTGEMAVLKARAAHEAIEQNRKQQRRKMADMSLAAIIAILVASIITLLITR